MAEVDTWLGLLNLPIRVLWIIFLGSAQTTDSCSKMKQMLPFIGACDIIETKPNTKVKAVKQQYQRAEKCIEIDGYHFEHFFTWLFFDWMDFWIRIFTTHLTKTRTVFYYEVIYYNESPRTKCKYNANIFYLFTVFHSIHYIVCLLTVFPKNLFKLWFYDLIS